MMKVKKIIKNRKGLSSLFVALYLAILAILLISMLFIGLDISNSALNSGMRTEQERMQESIALSGPEALIIAGGSVVQSMRVNNTGSITVRIRALYIDSKFICDPSKFQGDSYINPKESLWIQLYPNVNPPIVLNSTTLNAYWTVTTERGIRASETGGKLKWGEPSIPYSPKKFYMGPLMLMFDMFHWRSGSGPWRSGWTIPKGTKDVTWRILLVNVDDRDITVTDTSCLTLISNDNSPKDPLPWYIDPTLSTLTFKPGIFNFVYYTWSKPYSESGTSRQAVTGMRESTTCINFLTFFGNFVEPNGTLTPFGQTIPFEAVLVTTESMAGSVKLTSNPGNIRNNGISTSVIKAEVRDTSGNLMPNAWVEFYTTAGTLSATRNITDAQGIATVTLTSSTARTIAYLTAICESVEGTCKVVFTPASGIRVVANPSTIKVGGTSTITVQIVDENGVAVAQSGITITVVMSWAGQKPPRLIYGDQSGDSVTVTTDSNGKAIITLTATDSSGKPTGTGTATITASASGLSSGTTSVTVTK